MRRSSLFAVAICALFGCAPTNPGLTIDGVLSLGDTCRVSTSSDFLLTSVLDTNPDVPAAFAPRDISYFVTLRVANHLINTGNRVYPVRADTSVISITGAEITVSNTDGSPIPGIPSPYRVTGSGSIGSTTSNEPTLGITTIEAIPPQFGESLVGLTGTIILSIRVIGLTSGGSQLISGETLVPVRLCSGCLFQCVVDAMTMEPIEDLACAPGQDAVSSICP